MSQLLQSEPWKSSNGGRKYSGHIAAGGTSVDTIPSTITAILPNTLNSATTSYNAITTPSNINTAVLNTLLIDSSTSTGDTYAGQDGLVQIKSGNASNYTGAIYGDVGSIYHYGSGTITTGAAVLGQVRLDGPGAYTAAAGVYGLALHTGSGTIGSVGTLYARNITWVGSTPTITNQYGLQIDSPVRLGGTITNNYGVYIVDQGTVATNNYNFYSAGTTANNYIDGILTINTGLTLNDTVNIALGTTNGTKIGTATTQKVGFWNATPIVQPTTAVAAATFVANAGTAVNDASTFDGYTIKQVVKALRNIGLLA